MNPPELTYEEARKLVLKEKPSANYMQIGFSWYISLIVPFEDGVKLIEAMKLAELLTDSSSEVPIKTFDERAFTTRVISAETYREMKIATLLGVPLRDLPSLKAGGATT